MARLVPAWQAAFNEYSHPDWVYIYKDEIDNMGWPKAIIVHRLTPVDPEKQARLREIKPEWAKSLDNSS